METALARTPRGSAGTEAAIELVGVSKSFRGRRVLTDVHLDIPRGRITALLGPSGAGKTVTIKHVLGLHHPSRGIVRLDGRNLRMLSDEELNDVRRSLGVVLQGTLPFTCGLFYSLTVFENVAFPLRDRTRMNEREIHEAVLGWLGTVGLRQWASAMPNQLSAGMAKRVALARALATEPDIVIVDDFDSGIDPVRLGLLCEVLQELQRAAGSTFLLSTHDMNAARMLADRVAVIHEGRIVAAGEAEAVFLSDEPLIRQFVTGTAQGPIGLEG